jgi:hypothetical protein
VTADEVAAIMAMKAPIKSPEEWGDFFSLPPELQAAEARLIKGAVFQRDDGPTVWDGMLAFLGVAATLAGDATGIGGALQAFKAIP